MRHIISLKQLLVFAVGMFGFTFLAFCQGKILTFEGHVTRVPLDFSGLAWKANFYQGQVFSISLLIDPSTPGTFVDTNSVSLPIAELANPLWPGFYENAFYVGFVSGTRMWDSALVGEGPYSANYGGSAIFNFPPPIPQYPFGTLVVAGGPNVSNHWVIGIEKVAETLAEADPRNWQIGDIFDAHNKCTINYAFSDVEVTVTLTSIALEPDNDGDGVPDRRDACPNTQPGEAVDRNGCSISQLVPCDGPWKNHGEYVRKVVEVASEFAQQGLITDTVRSEVVSKAANSICGKAR